jgi:hypothetical protein
MGLEVVLDQGLAEVALSRYTTVRWQIWQRATG